jgi:hypothetical protein
LTVFGNFEQVLGAALLHLRDADDVGGESKATVPAAVTKGCKISRRKVGRGWRRDFSIV